MKKASNQANYMCLTEFRPESTRKSLIDEKNKEACRCGMSYGQLAAQEYIEKYGRVKL